MMAAKRLPGEDEAAEGAALAAVNAVDLLGDADLFANAGRYGSAVSLVVLAFEESVKARTLGAITAAAAQGRNPGFSHDTIEDHLQRSSDQAPRRAAPARRGYVPGHLRQVHARHRPVRR
jgi:hypothetical protein